MCVCNWGETEYVSPLQSQAVAKPGLHRKVIRAFCFWIGWAWASPGDCNPPVADCSGSTPLRSTTVVLAQLADALVLETSGSEFESRARHQILQDLRFIGIAEPRGDRPNHAAVL